MIKKTKKVTKKTKTAVKKSTKSKKTAVKKAKTMKRKLKQPEILKTSNPDFVLNATIDAKVKHMSRGFPYDITNSIKQFNTAFVHSYPNLDAVLMGMDLVSRPSLVQMLYAYSPNLGDQFCYGIVMKVCDADLSKLKKLLLTDNRIFLGAIRVKGVARAYLEGINGNYIYITGMGSSIEGE